MLRSNSWLLLVAGALIIQTATGFLIYKQLGAWEQRGQFGDMFGAVNTLFSGLALAGIIYAIYLQKEELRLQRRELQLTRLQMTEQTRIHEERLQMSLSGQRPLLRFRSLGDFAGDPIGPDDYNDLSNWKYGSATLRLYNSGGPMYHSSALIYYIRGAFAERFPCDQWENAYLLPTGTSGPEIGHDISAQSLCDLRLPFRLLAQEHLRDVRVKLSASLVVKYIDFLQQPRVSYYQVIMKHDAGTVFLLEDMDPGEAQRRGLLGDFFPSQPPGEGTIDRESFAQDVLDEYGLD